jgi:hypothetical protein
MRRTSYQKGSLKLADRKNGKAWEYRWREVQIDGSIRRKNIVIGTLEEYPNPSTAHQRYFLGDACQPLPAARVTRHLQQDQAGAGCYSGRLQVIFNAEYLRELSDQMDSTPVGILPAQRGESCPSGRMVERALFCRYFCSPGARNESQDQKHHECSLFSRNPVGVGGQEPDHKCSPECKATASSRYLAAGGDCGNSRQVAGASSHSGRVGRFHRLAARRTDRASVAGHRFPRFSNPCSPLGFSDGSRVNEDGSICERRSTGCRTRGVAQAVPGFQSVQGGYRLGLCQRKDEGQTTPLAGFLVAAIRQACRGGCEGKQASGLSHVPPHIWDVAECQWRESEGSAGTLAACQPEDHNRHLHAGAVPRQAAGTGKTHHDGQGKEGNGLRLRGPYWTIDPKPQKTVSPLECWRGRRDSNSRPLP